MNSQKEDGQLLVETTTDTQESRSSSFLYAPSNFRRRKLSSKIIKSLALVALVIVLVPVADILYLFVYNGALAISIARLTQNTIGPQIGGDGLYNAIEGTFFLMGLSAAIVIPIGVFGGVYLAEFSENNRFAFVIRFIADILAGVPSIVLGFVGFTILVLYFNWGFSAMAAAITISVFMLPYVIRTTELALRRVPNSIREGALSLGSSKTSMINRLTLRFAFPGILTGILLALSLSVGETAPLLYTASFGSYPTLKLFHDPVGYLTYIVFVDSEQPYANAHELAYLATFLLIIIVLSINVVSRIALRRFSKQYESRI